MGFGLPGKKRNQAKGFAKSENKSEKSEKKQRLRRATFPLEGIKTPSVIGLLGAKIPISCMNFCSLYCNLTYIFLIYLTRFRE